MNSLSNSKSHLKMTKNPKISPVYFSAIADLVGWVDERKPNIATKQYSLPKLINIIHPTVTVFFEKFRAIAISSYYQGELYISLFNSECMDLAKMLE